VAEARPAASQDTGGGQLWPGPRPLSFAAGLRADAVPSPRIYPKDPRASFGKHVLTPSLALSSVAGAPPAHWDVRYWDENLLQGQPPHQPFREVRGRARAGALDEAPPER
jgi:hypothetical protein